MDEKGASERGWVTKAHEHWQESDPGVLGLVCSCNSVYDIYLDTQESLTGRGWWKQESRKAGGDEYDGKERRKGKEGQ